MNNKDDAIKTLVRRRPKIISAAFLEQAKRLGEICNRSPGDYVSNWFKNIDVLISLEYNGVLIGLFTGRFFSHDILYLPVALLHPHYQNKKLARRSIVYIIRSYTLWAIVRCPWKLFGTYLIAFRTQNPIAYSSWIGRGMEVYPNQDTSLDQISLHKIKNFASIMWPIAQLDSDNLILRDAYKNSPGMIYSYNNIPWSGNKTIDDFFEEKLCLTRDSSNAFVVVVKRKFIAF